MNGRLYVSAIKDFFKKQCVCVNLCRGVLRNGENSVRPSPNQQLSTRLRSLSV